MCPAQRANLWAPARGRARLRTGSPRAVRSIADRPDVGARRRRGGAMPAPFALRSLLAAGALLATLACTTGASTPTGGAPAPPAGGSAPAASAPAAASSAPAPTAAHAPDKLKIAYNAVTADQTPIWLAQDAGIHP